MCHGPPAPGKSSLCRGAEDELHDGAGDLDRHHRLPRVRSQTAQTCPVLAGARVCRPLGHAQWGSSGAKHPRVVGMKPLCPRLGPGGYRGSVRSTLPGRERPETAGCVLSATACGIGWRQNSSRTPARGSGPHSGGESAVLPARHAPADEIRALFLEGRMEGGKRVCWPPLERSVSMLLFLPASFPARSPPPVWRADFLGWHARKCGHYAAASTVPSG